MKKTKLKIEDEEKLLKASDILAVKFKNLNLLKIALTHRSYLNENKEAGLQHNERFEFLGDAVLELIVSKYLFDKYNNKNEGELTSFRSAVVRTESLYEEIKKMGINEYIYMSRGEEQTGGRKRPYILANTFEAIVGAIYLDQGLISCEKFLRKTIFYKIQNIVKNRLDIDSKSKLQEIAQDILKDTPVYKIIKEEGPDHNKTFTSQVLIKGKDFGQGSGLSKQEAEQKAAEDALINWKKSIAKYFKLD